MPLGPMVRRLREALDLTQEQLATKAGIDRSYVGHIERGDRDAGPDVVRALAKALRVEPNVLFEAALDLKPPEDVDLSDPELRLMFDDIGRLTPEERESVKEAIRLVRRIQQGGRE